MEFRLLDKNQTILSKYSHIIKTKEILSQTLCSISLFLCVVKCLYIFLLINKKPTLPKAKLVFLFIFFYPKILKYLHCQEYLQQFFLFFETMPDFPSLNQHIRRFHVEYNHQLDFLENDSLNHTQKF